MTRRDRRRTVGRAESGGFLRMPHAVMDCANYRALSAHACKLLYDLASLYRGNNNGDLCAAWKLMADRGWRSRDTLDRAKKELLHYGFIELTRQGGLNSPSLYAITWQAIDECKGKLDVTSTRVASGAWKVPRPRFERRKRRRPKLEAQHAERVSPARQSCQSSHAD